MAQHLVAVDELMTDWPNNGKLVAANTTTVITSEWPTDDCCLGSMITKYQV
jgi:hypothetical protein